MIHVLARLRVTNMHVVSSHTHTYINSAPEDRRQRDIFQGLLKLLQGKKEALSSGNDRNQGATALIDEYGGTNIMTLQQDSP